MPRILPKPIHKYPWYLQILFFLQRKKLGTIPEPLLLWGRSPLLLLAFLRMWKKLNRKKSPLPPDLRALVCVKVSQVNSCSFCIDLNTSLFLQRGGNLEKIKELAAFQTSDAFQAQERAAIQYAEEMTKGTIGPELFSELRAHFHDDALIELTALIAFQNMSSKFNTALNL